MSNERDDKVEALIKVCKRILCYLPRAYDSGGPHGEMLEAISELEEAE